MASGGFKASKYFNSMKEIEELLEEIKNNGSHEEYLMMKKLLGLAEQQGQYRDIPGIGKIDRSIAAFIESWNAMGMKTLSSCSGLRGEHPADFEVSGGYVSFLKTPKSIRIERICQQLDLPVQEGEVYLQSALTISVTGETDEAILSKWRQLHTCFIEEE